jgi:hypothetical protein
MHSARGVQIACERAPMARDTDTRRTAALEPARGAAPQVPGAPPLVVKGACGAGVALPQGAAHRLFAREEPLGTGRGAAIGTRPVPLDYPWQCACILEPTRPKKSPNPGGPRGRGHSSSASSSTATRSTPSASRLVPQPALVLERVRVALVLAAPPALARDQSHCASRSASP